MLGKRDPQRDLFGAASRLAVDVEKLGFFGRLATDGHRVFRDSDFASCYSPIGRPSAPPSQIALARLLQHYEGVSDDQVIERLKYDLRWKVALDLDPLTLTAPFAKSTFQAFRVRLTLHAKEGLAFERSIKLARESGVLPKRLVMALDSSPMRGRGAVKDTFNLLSDAIRAVVRAIATKRERPPEEQAAAIGVERHFRETSIKGSELVDWEDSRSVSTFLAGLLEECDKVVVAAAKAKCASDEVDLLQKVVAQDVDPTGDDGPKIRDGVAKDRLVSITDPEIRHGHKSDGRIYSGHKAHLAVDTASGVVTAIAVSSPSTSDGSKVAELLATTERLTKSEVAEAIGDTAYSSRPALAGAEQAGVPLLTKMPKSPKGRFGPNDFKVSRDRTRVRCPAGHSSTGLHRSKTGEYQHVWAPRLCGACPLRAQCTKAQRRTFNVFPDYHERRARERRAHTKKGRMKLRKRMAAEHAIARMKKRGCGESRYFGREKTHAQWLWTGAAVNLSLSWSAETRNAPRRAA
jgi:transposase